MWLPEAGIVPFTSRTLPRIDEREFSRSSYALVFAKRRAAFGTDTLRLPHATFRPGELVYLVDVLRDDRGRVDDGNWAEDMRARHTADMTYAHDMGGVPYPVGTEPGTVTTGHDWPGPRR